MRDKRSGVKILLGGEQGSGKTTQGLTLPGPKLAILFDPSARAAVEREFDDVVEWMPKERDLRIGVRTVKKAGKIRQKQEVKKEEDEPRLYNEFVEWFFKQDFSKYESVMLDTGTYLARALMQVQFWLGEKAGRDDERIDHRYAGETFTDLIWGIAASIPGNLLVNLHTEYKKLNRDAGRETHNLRVPGEAKRSISSAFTCAWRTFIKPERAGPRFLIQTRNDGSCTWCRNGIHKVFRDLDTYQDVTGNSPTNLGKLLKEMK
jgi:hypothetical protein